MHIYPINGAAQRAGKADTAFSFRDANFAEVIVGVDPDPANNPRIMQWAKDYWLALHPHSSGGGYINMMMDEGEDNVKAAYGDNYAARPGEGEVRPGEPVPREPEHPAGEVMRLSSPSTLARPGPRRLGSWRRRWRRPRCRAPGWGRRPAARAGSPRRRAPSSSVGPPRSRLSRKLGFIAPGIEAMSSSSTRFTSSAAKPMPIARPTATDSAVARSR